MLKSIRNEWLRQEREEENTKLPPCYHAANLVHWFSIPAGIKRNWGEHEEISQHIYLEKSGGC